VIKPARTVAGAGGAAERPAYSDPMASKGLPADLRAAVVALLRDGNQRLTPNREALLEVLHGARTRPLTIPEIVAERPSLAVSTVYRNLTVLEDAGVVHRIVARGDHAYYELVEDLTEHHHHMVCTRCGLVEDVPATPTIEKSVNDAVRQIARRTGFRTEHHRLDLVGLCKQCA
jgi:Fe2+ or Zn2+ uptake regulation protein